MSMSPDPWAGAFGYDGVGAVLGDTADGFGSTAESTQENPLDTRHDTKGERRRTPCPEVAAVSHHPVHHCPFETQPGDRALPSVRSESAETRRAIPLIGGA